MWLVKVELGDIADQQTFACKVCDATVKRTVHCLTEVLGANHVESTVGRGG